MHKVLLIIRDGWGYSKKKEGNAIMLAKPKNEEFYQKNYPWSLLGASGNAVGLPSGTQGTSEVGHLTIGAGRVVWQPLEQINNAIKDTSFFENPALRKAISNAKKKNASLHAMGLFSDQGVHSTNEHLYALLKLAKMNGIKKVFVHAFLDGRDAPKESAPYYIKEFEKESRKIGVGTLATLMGRFYAMDRDNNYDRIKVAYDALIKGIGEKTSNPTKAVEKAYKSMDDPSDQYVKPIIIVDNKHKPIATIKENDSVIFYNFRTDRTRELTYALTENSFNKFSTKPLNLTFVCMTQYDEKLTLPVAFMQQTIQNNLTQILSERGKKQLRIAETEKYAHITYFFNSQVEKPLKGEERILINSPKLPSYADCPEMKAKEIAETAMKNIKTSKYDFIALNFANTDLVGHSGKLSPTIKAVSITDECTGPLVEYALEHEYAVMITSDHGNAEEMLYPDGKECPAHTLNPVPTYLITKEKLPMQKKGELKDIAPTILDLMEIPVPREMTGKSLLRK